MRGFIAQLVEHRTGIAEVKGSNLVEALIFSSFFLPDDHFSLSCTTAVQILIISYIFHIKRNANVRMLKQIEERTELTILSLVLSTKNEVLLHIGEAKYKRGSWGVLPYMGYIGMCRCEGYGFRAVYSSMGYINQGVWV